MTDSRTSSRSVRVLTEGERTKWDEQVNAHGGHPLQLWGWGQLKANSGNWTPHRLLVQKPNGDVLGGAQVLLRRLPAPMGSLGFVPRGPFVERGRQGSAAEVEQSSQTTLDSDVSVAAARTLREKTDAISVIFEPDVPIEQGFFVDGGKEKSTSILLERTAVLDLSLPSDKLLSQMSKKTRQYIRKGEREGITVRRVGQARVEDGRASLDDTARGEIAQVLDIYRETAERAGFPLHEDSYYLDVAVEMGAASQLYAAYMDGQMQAFLWLVSSDTVAFELYGGVTEAGQRSRANYALKWAAITRAQDSGVLRYDLNGLLNDGVSRFKQGFITEETLLHPGLEVPLRPLKQKAWAVAIPSVRAAIRRLRA